MNRRYLTHRLRVYADACDRAPTTVALMAAVVTFVVVAGIVAVDLQPKARAARWLARRLEP